MPATDGTWRIATLRDAARKWLAARLLKRRRPAMDWIAASGDQSPAETVLQQLTRVRTAGGGQALRGSVLFEFAAGERAASCHVAFCPVFEALPEVEVEVVDEPLARVRVVQLLHNGLQLEVQLPEATDEPISVSVELYAATRDGG